MKKWAKPIVERGPKVPWPMRATLGDWFFLFSFCEGRPIIGFADTREGRYFKVAAAMWSARKEAIWTVPDGLTTREAKHLEKLWRDAGREWPAGKD